MRSLGIEGGAALPLIQAPMAGCQGLALASAVAGAGALGSLPTALLDNATLDTTLRQPQARTQPLNLNFFAHATALPAPEALQRWQRRLLPHYQAWGITQVPPARPGRRAFDAATAEVLEAHRPAVVSFHFGLPAQELLARLRARGAFLMASATTLREALWLQRQGVDAVIAQGLEAGGHRGHFLDLDPAQQAPLHALLRQLVPALSVPVVAAGGIASAAQLRAALDLGAAAVQVGTAFLLCDEAETPALHRARLLDTQAETLLTRLFTGGLARGLPNRLTQDLGPRCADAPPFPWAAAALAPLRQAAEAAGRDDYSPLWCGSDRSGLHAGPAAEVVRRLTEGLAC